MSMLTGSWTSLVRRCTPIATRKCLPTVAIHSSKPSSSMAQVSPFTKAVIASMRQLYPEILADKSFDNTGLLLEAPLSAQLPRKANSVLLTIDLTRAVADEAIEENVSAVVAYHPIIFRGLKSLTLEDSQQQTLLRLASHGVSVYSPHTAVDIVPGGMADWLCDIVTGKVVPDPEPRAFTSEQAIKQELSVDSVQQSEQASETDVTTSEDEVVSSDTTDARSSTDPFLDDPKTPEAKEKRPHHIHRTYSKPAYPSRLQGCTGRDEPVSSSPISPIQSSAGTTFHHSVIPHARFIITPSPSAAIDAANSARTSDSAPSQYTSENTGAGRVIAFEEPQPLASLITRIAHATGTPKGFPVAIPQSLSLESIRIKSVGICPGSGSSVIRTCKDPPDLVFTGEMSHHEALAVIERGGCVITLFHSNSERGYLGSVMRERLEKELQQRWQHVTKEHQASSQGMLAEILSDTDVRVIVSRRDRDPFGIVVLQESSVEGQKVG